MNLMIAFNSLRRVNVSVHTKLESKPTYTVSAMIYGKTEPGKFTYECDDGGDDICAKYTCDEFNHDGDYVKHIAVKAPTTDVERVHRQ